MRFLAIPSILFTASSAFVIGPRQERCSALKAVDVDPQIIAGAAVVVAGAAAAAFAAQQQGGGASKTAEKSAPEPEPEPIDVSIPYDAAIEQAFDEWKSEDESRKDTTYEAFKPLYIAKTVAQVSLKKAERDLA